MRSELRQDLIRDEGMRQTAYKDSVGLWTIGVGHLIDDGNTPPRIMKLTIPEVYAFLEADVADAEERCRELFPDWGLIDTVRQDALINMSFNLGNRLAGFKKFITKVNTAAISILPESAWWAAGREMMDSKWAQQVGQRAVRLRAMIETGRRL